MNVNRAELIGNLTQEPEVKKTATGKDVVTFSVATNYKYKTKEGELKSEAEYHNCVAFGKLADIIQKYVHKGDKVYLDGRLKTNHWDDQTGSKKQKTSIILSNIIMLGNKGESENNTKPVQPSTEPEINVDDIF